ncbi:MAG TPA: methyltransferase domain-containing protein [Rhizomicrobium sp.]|jgi:2-polyprenyl-6-hydroxyphenyl methylase/3-demethylubiquinone-9 3-methyltransferase
MAELTQAESHFRFGQNWADFARQIEQPRIEQAQRDLARLLGHDHLDGLRFLDIGSGSGIHSLAALRMNAEITAIDIDADSVSTTRALLARFAPHSRWTAEVRSVFDLTPESFGRFDIVYSWGVLHHTGAMYDAIRSAASLVDEHGTFCVALYGRTMLCGVWRLEKRLYSRAPEWVQRSLQRLYVGAWWTAQSIKAGLRGRRFSLREHTENYLHKRGMSFHTDVHDWLGGYPYESVAPEKLRDFMCALGFEEQRSFIQPGLRHGLFGYGCDEYVFVRKAAPVSA